MRSKCVMSSGVPLSSCNIMASPRENSLAQRFGDTVKEAAQACKNFFSTKKCGLPGCEKECYTNTEYGYPWQYDHCCRTHARLHARIKEQQRRAHYESQYAGTGPVYFYNSDKAYYVFTNFFEAEIKIDGVIWPTTEHYFQAQKFVGTPYLEYIQGLSRPREAFEFTRRPGVSRWRRTDWESVKIDVMRKALLAKFSQHSAICSILLNTQRRKLIEQSPYDSFWGDGGDGRGRNELGKLLMDIRTQLQEKGTTDDKKKKFNKHSAKNESGVDAHFPLTQAKVDSATDPPIEASESSCSSSSASNHTTPEDSEPEELRKTITELHAEHDMKGLDTRVVDSAQPLVQLAQNNPQEKPPEEQPKSMEH